MGRGLTIFLVRVKLLKLKSNAKMSKLFIVRLMRALALGHPPPLVFKQNNTGTNILGATFNYYFERAH